MKETMDDYSNHRQLVPLRLLRSSCSGNNYANHRQLAIVSQPTTSSGSRFQLPHGWGIEEVPRADGTRFDKYFYEPGTGRKFRSYKSIERYLSGEPYTPRTRALPLNRNHSPRPRRMIVSGGKMVRLDDERNRKQLALVSSTSSAKTLSFDLPDGWIVEEVPRRCGGQTDRYYYEPGTGQKFRSRIAVQKYLAELDEDAPLSQALAEIKENKPLAKVFKLSASIKNSVPGTKNMSREKKEAPVFVPPKKVNWVLGNPQGDSWNAFISGSMVSDSVQQEWSKRFMSTLNNGVYDPPNST